MPIEDFILDVDGEDLRFYFEGDGQNFLSYAQENLQDFYNADPLDLQDCKTVEFHKIAFDDEDLQQLGSYLASSTITEIIFTDSCTFQTQNIYNFLDLATLDKEEIFLSFTDDSEHLSGDYRFTTSENQLREIFLFSLNNPEKKVTLLEASRSITVSNLNSFIENVLGKISQSFETEVSSPQDFLQNAALFSRFFPDPSIVNIDCISDENIDERAAEFVARIREREGAKATPCSTASRKHHRDRDDENGPSEMRLVGRNVRQALET